MTHPLLVAGGRVVTPQGVREADILCAGGRIVDILPPATRNRRLASDVIDARGLHCFPGFVDPHVHSRVPGQTQKEDIPHLTRAAAAAGVTTLLIMPNTVPALTSPTDIAARAKDYAVEAMVDFGFWFLGYPYAPSTYREMASAGAIGAKVFLAYGFDRDSQRVVPDWSATDNVLPPPRLRDLVDILNEGARSSLVVGVHAELHELLRGGFPSTYDEFLSTRPEIAEVLAVAALIETAAVTGARLHLLHLSSKRSVELVRDARSRGLQVTAETCPHYLAFTREDFATLGPRMKVFPPMRTKADQDALWSAVADGTIDTIGSDHAPHTVQEKAGSLAEQPGGVIGIETASRVMLDAVAKGRISLSRLAWLYSEGASRVFGLYPRKGAILPGSDADLALVDLSRKWETRNEQLHSLNPVSLWHGRQGTGCVVGTLLRGMPVMRDGVVIDPPRGQMVTPQDASVPRI